MPYQIFCTMDIPLNAPRLRDISPREFGFWMGYSKFYTALQMGV